MNINSCVIKYKYSSEFSVLCDYWVLGVFRDVYITNGITDQVGNH